ncbi:hypothetical protein CFP71_21505 [Amycolatopsis thailandensis]|nr:hypothetical protein CFP71_21505 [Amycolatopsis thailandensis]
MPLSTMAVYERWDRPAGIVEVISVVSDDEAKAARWLIADYDSGEHGPRWSRQGSPEDVINALFETAEP